MRKSVVMSLGAFGLALGVSGCSGLYLGDGLGREVAKETGPLTVPPAGVRAGTAP